MAKCCLLSFLDFSLNAILQYVYLDSLKTFYCVLCHIMAPNIIFIMLQTLLSPLWKPNNCPTLTSSRFFANERSRSPQRLFLGMTRSGWFAETGMPSESKGKIFPSGFSCISVGNSSRPPCIVASANTRTTVICVGLIWSEVKLFCFK